MKFSNLVDRTLNHVANRLQTPSATGGGRVSHQGRAQNQRPNGIPLGHRPKVLYQGKYCVQNDQGEYVPERTGGQFPGKHQPNPEEFGLPPGQRQVHQNSSGNFFNVLDDGSEHSLMGGSYTPDNSSALQPPPQQSAFATSWAAPVAAPPGRPAEAVGQPTTPPPAYQPYGSQGYSPAAPYGNNYQSGRGPDRQHWTPLMHAMNNPQIPPGMEADIVSQFAGEINRPAPDTGHTPLINATINGKTRFANELLNQGAALNQGDKMGRTPLASAAAFGKGEVLELFLNRLASEPHKLSQALNQQDNAGFKPIMLAARNGQPTLDTLSRYIHLSATPHQDIKMAQQLANGKLQNVLQQQGPQSPAYAVAYNNVQTLLRMEEQYPM